MAAAILAALLFAPPAVEISTVDDRVVTGVLAALDGEGVTVQSSAGAERVPLAEALELKFTSSSGEAAGETGEIACLLRSGGSLSCRDVGMQDRVVAAESFAAGAIRLPLAAVRAIRFRAADDVVAREWEKLAASEPERDLLVVRSGDVLDRLEGTLSSLDPRTLTFLVGETRHPIDRTKPRLFGVVLGRSAGPTAKAIGDLKFRNSDRLPVTALTLEGETLSATLPGGSEPARVSVSNVEAIDFGRGKVQYLAQLTPREKEHTPYFGEAPLDSVFDVLVDRSDAGPDAPIRIEGQTFRRGLVIHSRTRLTYRLNGEYRRLVAVAGIEELVRPLGDVELVISGDGKELLRRNVKGTDPALPLDLDLAGVRDLTILVDFAGQLDISDHLALGDARLIK